MKGIGARNKAEIDAMLMAALYKMMHATSKDILKDMDESMHDYYRSGTPTVYNRTYTMWDTPTTSPIETDTIKKSASFNAYLDTNYRYTTGKRPTMKDVLLLANDDVTSSSVGYLRSTVGNMGFWEKGIKNANKRLDDNIKKYFRAKKI